MNIMQTPSSRTWDREELAWAAGLFDGEGCIHASKSGKFGRQVPILSVGQRNPYVLHRFMWAVSGTGPLLGHVHGPDSQTKYGYKASYRHTIAIVAILWQWLSPPKRDQATRVFALARKEA